MRASMAHIGSDPDDKPFDVKALLKLLGAGAIAVLAAIVILQDRAIARGFVWTAGVAMLGIFGYLIAKSHRDEKAGLIAALVLTIQTIFFFVYGLADKYADAGGKTSSWVMIWGYGLYSLGELLVSGLGLAMIARYVPARMGGFLMGAYYVGVGISQYLGGIVANYAAIPDN